MKSIYKLLLTLLLIPSVVLAKDGSSVDIVTILFVEAFITIHMTIFVHIPIAKVLANDPTGQSKLYRGIINAFIFGRIMILLLGNAIFGAGMMAFDFGFLFFGAFVLMPIFVMIGKSKTGASVLDNTYNASVSTPLYSVSNTTMVRDFATSAFIAKEIKVRPFAEDSWYETTAYFAKKRQLTYKVCYSCKSINKIDNEFCTNCGVGLTEENMTTKPGYCPKCRAKLNPGVKYCVNCGIEIGNYFIDPTSINHVEEGAVDYFFNQPEEIILSSIIDKELEENSFDKNKVIPALRKRKLLLTLIFAIVTCITISLVFFHLPAPYYAVYLIFLVIYLISINNYDVKKYILKQIKSRPDEKINNVVASVVASAVPKKAFGFEYLAMFIVAIALPLAIFSKPRIFYEKVDGGYAMRFYAFGWSEMTKATIPETYKGEPVISLRGNAFSNMFLLKKVELPDTITEIRGQAFKNDLFLEEVNIPSNLQYLGGGAFYNCESIREIVLPNTVTEMGGETFYGASRLKTLVLSDKLLEIRGSTCEGCASLEEITIPDSVTRIGGHAFHGASSLTTVNISSSSQLKTIGSSAFRECYRLGEIYLPYGATYEKNSFKGTNVQIKKYLLDDKGNVRKSDLSERHYFSTYSNNDPKDPNTDGFVFIDYENNKNVLVLESVRTTANGAYSYKFGYYVNDKLVKNVFIYSTDETKIIDDNIYVEVEYTSSSYISLNIFYSK